MLAWTSTVPRASPVRPTAVRSWSPTRPVPWSRTDCPQVSACAIWDSMACGTCPTRSTCISWSISGLRDGLPAHPECIDAQTRPARANGRPHRPRARAGRAGGAARRPSGSSPSRVPGGTGKTSLAVEAARRYATSNPGARPLGAPGLGHRPRARRRDHRGTARCPARARGGHPSMASATSWTIDRYCCSWTTWSSCWARRTWSSELIQRARGLRVLATSRAPLHLRQEQEYPVAPLPVPLPDRPADGMRDNPSVRLFLARAKRVRPDFSGRRTGDGCGRAHLSATGRPATGHRARGITGRACCRRRPSPSGSPDVWTCRVVHPGTHPSASAPWPRRSRGASTCSSRTSNDASPASAVFAGGARLDEVEAVWGVEPPPGSDALDIVSALVDQSLVVAQPGHDGLRIRLLETIRIFATDRLARDVADDAQGSRTSCAGLPVAGGVGGRTSARTWTGRVARPALTGTRQPARRCRLGRGHRSDRRSRSGWGPRSGASGSSGAISMRVEP